MDRGSSQYIDLKEKGKLCRLATYASFENIKLGRRDLCSVT